MRVIVHNINNSHTITYHDQVLVKNVYDVFLDKKSLCEYLLESKSFVEKLRKKFKKYKDANTVMGSTKIEIIDQHFRISCIGMTHLPEHIEEYFASDNKKYNEMYENAERIAETKSQAKAMFLAKSICKDLLEMIGKEQENLEMNLRKYTYARESILEHVIYLSKGKEN